MNDQLQDEALSGKFKRVAAEISDTGSLREPAFAAGTYRAGRGRLHRLASYGSFAPPRHLRRTLALALGVVVLSAGGAYAAVTFTTVPTHVTVTGPNGQGIPPSSVPSNDIVPSMPQTVTFAQAQQDVAFPILVLPASIATPQQWQIVPPERTKSGGPVSPGEVMTPQVYVIYLLSSGATVSISEYPEQPGTPLNVDVKWYGAASTHQATVDGYRVVYQSTGSDVGNIVFKTTTGLEVWMSPSQNLADVSAPVVPVTLAQWVSLIEALSPSPGATSTPSPTGVVPTPSP